MSSTAPPGVPPSTHSFLRWAEDAAKLRFGKEASCRYLETGGCGIFLGARMLASAATWLDAITEAVKRNTDIPQPSGNPFVEGHAAPEGEEHIEEFCQAMRGRDIFTEFLLWYGAKRDALPDPEGWPRTRSRSDWLENFIWFIQEGGKQ